MKLKVLPVLLLAVLLAFPTAGRAQRLTGAQVADSIRSWMEECRTMGLATVLFKGNDILYQNAYGKTTIIIILIVDFGILVFRCWKLSVIQNMRVTKN